MIEVKNRSMYFAYQEYGEEIGDAIVPNFDPIGNVLVDNEEEQYVHLLVWTRYQEDGEKRLRLVEMSGDGVILSDTKKKLKEYKKKRTEEEALRLFPNDCFPYFFTPDMFRENTIWGKATAELLLNVSDQIDDLDDHLLRNARLTGNPMMLVGNSSGIDVGKITNEPRTSDSDK